MAANAINRTREPAAGYGAEGVRRQDEEAKKNQLTTRRQNIWPLRRRGVLGGGECEPPTIEAAAAARVAYKLLL